MWPRFESDKEFSVEKSRLNKQEPYFFAYRSLSPAVFVQQLPERKILNSCQSISLIKKPSQGGSRGFKSRSVHSTYSINEPLLFENEFLALFCDSM
jgi:hypothetical protein